MVPVTTGEAAALLGQAQNVLILSHRAPDGDTLGSAFAVAWALNGAGKRVHVICADPIPTKYSYLYKDLPKADFEPDFILAVDVADERLLGDALLCYADRVDLCIDHHHSNTGYARHLLLKDMASACEVVLEVLDAMGVSITPVIASAIYTGVSTDTGCFKYANTTPHTLRVAARMMECGIDTYRINRLMFELRSREQIELEKMVYKSLEFARGGACAFISITQSMLQQSGTGESDTEGLASIPRQIEGVLIGVTMRERADGSWKVSLRSGIEADASAICKRLGGGGHVRAAGCNLTGSREQVQQAILEAIAAECDG